MIQNNGPTFLNFCNENKLLLCQGDSEATKSTGAESGFYSSGRPARPPAQVVAYISSFNTSTSSEPDTRKKRPLKWRIEERDR